MGGWEERGRCKGLRRRREEDAGGMEVGEREIFVHIGGSCGWVGGWVERVHVFIPWGVDGGVCRNDKGGLCEKIRIGRKEEEEEEEALFVFVADVYIDCRRGWVGGRGGRGGGSKTYHHINNSHTMFKPSALQGTRRRRKRRRDVHTGRCGNRWRWRGVCACLPLEEEEEEEEKKKQKGEVGETTHWVGGWVGGWVGSLFA